ncbi:MAG: hypothetical protein AAGA28_10250 [Pseudomonadota bacterium]
MKNATIAHEQTARGVRDDLTCRQNTVLPGHDAPADTAHATGATRTWRSLVALRALFFRKNDLRLCKDAESLAVPLPHAGWQVILNLTRKKHGYSLIQFLREWKHESPDFVARSETLCG